MDLWHASADPDLESWSYKSLTGFGREAKIDPWSVRNPPASKVNTRVAVVRPIPDATAYGRQQIRPQSPGRLQSRRRGASPRLSLRGPRDLDRDQAVPRKGRTQFKRQIVEQSPLMDRDTYSGQQLTTTIVPPGGEVERFPGLLGSITSGRSRGSRGILNPPTEPDPDESG
jgi:hypothetical protein